MVCWFGLRPKRVISAGDGWDALTFSGSLWSLGAGAAGAIGALGVILAFNFGGKPVFVMPLIFGGAPVVNTIVSLTSQGSLNEVGPIFLAGLILVIAGAAIVLVFAPRGAPPQQPQEEGTTNPAEGSTTVPDASASTTPTDDATSTELGPAAERPALGEGDSSSPPT